MPTMHGLAPKRTVRFWKQLGQNVGYLRCGSKDGVQVTVVVFRGKLALLVVHLGGYGTLSAPPIRCSTVTTRYAPRGAPNSCDRLRGQMYRAVEDEALALSNEMQSFDAVYPPT